MKSKLFLCILLSCLAMVPVSTARGGSPDGALLDLDWRVYVAAKPVYCLLVEKDRQRLRVLRHDGRIRVVAEYGVATGENPGPKEREGDSRTPEGIYLITKGYLDRKVSIFGTRAYQLNYPNWFDLGAGRGGNGIYLHGTNRPLQPKSSNGCVTLENDDLERLADYLSVGTPVFIVPTLKQPTVGEGQEEGYPDLTGDDFVGARDLLLPEGGGPTAFASLYLIRINGQTMVAGEYWADPESSATRQAVAYLQQAADKRWSVVDRGPVADGQQGAGSVTVAALPPELQREAGAGGAMPYVEPEFWEPATPALTLEWYREVMAQAPPPVSSPTPTPAPAVTEAVGVRPEVVYALFGLATCLSIGSALVLIRRRGVGEAGEDEAEAAGEGVIARVREEVRQAMDTLHAVQARIDKEAAEVESQEALKERVKGLEEAFGEKQAAIERLSADQEALKAAGAAERSGLSEELTRLRGELVAGRGEMEAARLEMAATGERAGAVDERLAEFRRLAVEKGSTMDGEAMQGVVTATCDQLREQVQAMLATLPRSEAIQGEEAGEAGRGYDEVVAELRGYAAEMRAAQAEMARHGEVADTTAVAAALEGVHLELREARREQAELSSRLARQMELELSLAGRDRELLAAREAAEEARCRALSEKVDLESRLAALGAELQEERAAKTELTGRLGRLQDLEARLAALGAELGAEQAAKTELSGRLARMGEVEHSLAERERELLALREAGEETRRRVETERAELESRLAALGAELEAERAAKSELGGSLARVGDLETAVAEREQELLALRQADEETRRRMETERAELESRLEALGAELRAEQAAKTELTGRLARMSEVEHALAERERELVSLREAGELVAASSATERSRLEASIAELVLARQVEVTTLTHAVQEAKERVVVEQEAIAALKAEVETARDALRQAGEREEIASQSSRDQERVVAELNQEIAAFKARVADLEKKAAVGDGVVLIKGSHYLPGDVLRKWIGQEQR